MSASAFLLSASSTNTHCQPWALEPVGACSASSRHSSSTSRGTGFSRSSRLRTERVVVRTSSTDRFRLGMGGDYIRSHDSRTDPRGFPETRSGPLRVVDHRGEIGPAGPPPGVVLFRRYGSDGLFDAHRREG